MTVIIVMVVTIVILTVVTVVIVTVVTVAVVPVVIVTYFSKNNEIFSRKCFAFFFAM